MKRGTGMPWQANLQYLQKCAFPGRMLEVFPIFPSGSKVDYQNTVF
jgi:hypothetical protein